MGLRILMAVVLMASVTASVTVSISAHASEQILPGLRPTETQRLKIWGFEIYDARLWTQPGFSVQQYASHPFALELS